MILTGRFTRPAFAGFIYPNDGTVVIIRGRNFFLVHVTLAFGKLTVCGVRLLSRVFFVVGISSFVLAF